MKILLGDFIDCGKRSDIHRLLRDIMAGVDIPVFSGFPMGHGDRNMTLPVGLQAELDTWNRKLTFLEDCVVP